MKKRKNFIDRGFLTTSQVAEICGVNRATVVRWIQHNELIAERTIGGRYRICSENLLILSNEKGIFIAPDKRSWLVEHKKTTPFTEPGADMDDEKQTKKTHILVIDDDQQFRNLIDEFLSIYGYKVTLADNGFQGLDYLLKDYSIKLVVLDLLMPGINGLETLRRIKSLRKDVPIIITSGFIEYYYPDGEESLKKEVDFILKKPFDLDELAIKCRQLLDLKIKESVRATT